MWDGFDMPSLQKVPMWRHSPCVVASWSGGAQLANLERFWWSVGSSNYFQQIPVLFSRDCLSFWNWLGRKNALTFPENGENNLLYGITRRKFSGGGESSYCHCILNCHFPCGMNRGYQYTSIVTTRCRDSPAADDDEQRGQKSFIWDLFRRIVELPWHPILHRFRQCPNMPWLNRILSPNQMNECLNFLTSKLKFPCAQGSIKILMNFHMKRV